MLLNPAILNSRLVKSLRNEPPPHRPFWACHAQLSGFNPQFYQKVLKYNQNIAKTQAKTEQTMLLSQEIYTTNYVTFTRYQP